MQATIPRSIAPDPPPLDLSDISAIGLGRAASDVLDLRQRVKRRYRPGERPDCDRESLAVLDRLLRLIEAEADRRDAATRRVPEPLVVER